MRVSIVPTWTSLMLPAPAPCADSRGVELPNVGKAGVVAACRILGHRYRFTAEGVVMRWSCERGCGAGGAKAYPTAAEAKRYARAFDREDREDVGRRTPLLAGLPLRLWWWLRRARGS
jgi:hypothetical protein